ncbi:MAG TPA: inositol monophosphatase family protein [Longimicrobiales bacterium]|nr:inositol monophosphatase family protein [Longimicrobiales bacterium]
MPDLPSDSHLDDLLRTAREAAEAAADVHARWAGRIGVPDASWKRFADLVSEADLAAQRAALEVIGRHRPDDAVMAEEGDAAETPLPSDGRPIWIVDPLDGTANFLHGHPMHAASVAVAISGRVMAGAVTASALGQRWWARRGGGAFRDGTEIHGSGITTLEGALVATGFPFKELDHREAYGAQLTRVLGSGAQVRRGGSAALDLCFLADGRFEAFWEAALQPWDYAAGALIVEEAGGACERVEGGTLELVPGSIIAGNSAEMLALLRTCVTREV